MDFFDWFSGVFLGLVFLFTLLFLGHLRFLCTLFGYYCYIHCTLFFVFGGETDSLVSLFHCTWQYGSKYKHGHKKMVESGKKIA